jgi:beta-glucosidase
MNKVNFLVAVAISSALVACSNSDQGGDDLGNKNIKIWPKLDIQVKADPKVEARVEKLLSGLSLEQKVAQMIQPEIRDITVEEMRQYGFGSYLNGGGAFPNNNKHATPGDWVQLAEDMYQASIDDSIDGSTIPTMWGTDAVHGHNNVVGATLFPHNIGLGAANNAELLEQIAQVTAKEVLATGIDWIFAPTVATVRDDRWGRTYEGYSEDPEIVKQYSAAIVTGLQGAADDNFLGSGRVISTVKHFVGDGGTIGGDDQGNNVTSEQELFDIHAQGYVGGLTVGAQSVMASFNSWHGDKIHGDNYLLTQVLKDRMGFDGLVVGDWNGHGQVAGCDNTSCPQSINAGVDIVMVPSDWKALYENTIEQVKQGVIKQERIDDAVRRILRVKVRAGLFDEPSPANRKYSGKTDIIGAPAHRALARQAVRESLVLLKNKSQLLPLSPKSQVLVAGDGADNIGKQSGGWSITWQGTNNTNADFPGGTSIYDGIKQQVSAAGGSVELSETGTFTTKPDVAIVVFGEEPYAEGVGDISDLEFQKGDKSDLALLQSLQQQGIPTVAVFITGRPMWINAELNASDAFVAAWLPGSEGAGVADVLFTDKNGEVQHDFVGKLSFSWPKTPLQIVNRGDKDYQPLLPYGFGLQYGDENVLPDNLSEVIDTKGQTAGAVHIHKQSLQKGWVMDLFAGSDTLEVNANSHTVAGLTYRTLDKLIQEDAFLLANNGQQNAGVKITTSKNMPAIKMELNASSSLTFEVNSMEASDKPLWLKLGCSNSDKCLATINLNDELKWLAGKQWHRLAIGMECLAPKLTDAEDFYVEFSTEGKAEVAFSNIQLRAESTNVQLKCE